MTTGYKKSSLFDENAKMLLHLRHRIEHEDNPVKGVLGLLDLVGQFHSLQSSGVSCLNGPALARNDQTPRDGVKM